MKLCRARNFPSTCRTFWLPPCPRTERMARSNFLFTVAVLSIWMNGASLALAQESRLLQSASRQSTSRPDPTAPVTSPAAASSASVPASDAPSAALRDLLAAACAHDETSFEKFLTARNAESFSRLTPTARTELMKRFVLLDDAGKPTVSANPSGRPDIRCTTAEG